jgi:hypothetical protein
MYAHVNDATAKRRLGDLHLRCGWSNEDHQRTFLKGRSRDIKIQHTLVLQIRIER